MVTCHVHWAQVESKSDILTTEERCQNILDILWPGVQLRQKCMLRSMAEDWGIINGTVWVWLRNYSLNRYFLPKSIKSRCNVHYYSSIAGGKMIPPPFHVWQAGRSHRLLYNKISRLFENDCTTHWNSTLLIISSTAIARISIYSTRVMSSQSLSEADRSFENQLPSVCLRTDKLTCLLTNWPTSWQPDLLPTTWPIFLVVDMSSCNWAVNRCCACSTA